jgi:hypothetical protein
LDKLGKPEMSQELEEKLRFRDSTIQEDLFDI